jgi:hypothetical protein
VLKNPFSILIRLKNHFYPLLNVRGINDVRQTETHVSESAVRNSNALKVKTIIESAESAKSLVDLEFREKLSTQKMKYYFLRIIKVSFLFGMQI